MTMDIKKLLSTSVEHRAEGAQDRFQVANSPAISAVWDAARQPQSETQPRKGKSNGYKYWLPENTVDAILKMKRQAQMLGLDSSQSQIVRAGIHLLQTLDEEHFRAIIEQECADDKARGARR